VRSILRHRDSLVQMASSHVQHMQKALDQMNLQLHHVISDITGVTGITILEAILAGERNPHTLAALRDGRVKATADTIAKSLVGDYRREHRFTLGQSLAAFRHYQELIGACDREIAQHLENFESKVDPPEGSLPESPDGQKPSGGEPRFDLQNHLYRIFGVDLTRIPGINVLTTQTPLAEIGPDLSRFPCAPRVYLLARTLFGQPGQRGESAVGQNTQGQESGGRGTAYGRPIASSQSILSGTLLSPDARQTRGSESRHRHGAQTSPHHLSHGDHPDRPTMRPSAGKTKCTIASAWSPAS